MHKPVIGVMPLVDEKRNSIWMLPGYLELIEAAGGIPLMLPLSLSLDDYEEIKGNFDGFLFTGGHDVDPSLYGAEKKSSCGAVSPERDALEKMIFTDAWNRDVPVFGICRGIQFINVMRQGTLYQDLDQERPSRIEHHMTPPYDRTVHKVGIRKDTPLYDLWKKNLKAVNSYHHQAVKRLGKDLTSMAISEDGLIEAVYAPAKKFIWAVQWHPEFIFRKDDDQLLLLQKFIKSC